MKRKLLMLFAATLSLAASAQHEGIAAAIMESEPTAVVTSEKTEIEKFSNVSATYLTWFDAFDKGYYGLCIEKFEKKGSMLTMSIKGSWGITTPGFYQWRIGSGKGWAVQDWCAFVLPVSCMMGNYVKNVKIDKKGEIEYEKDLVYGLVASPGLRFKGGSCVIGVGFDIGFDYAGKFEFYKGFELSFGVKI